MVNPKKSVEPQMDTGKNQVQVEINVVNILDLSLDLLF